MCHGTSLRVHHHAPVAREGPSHLPALPSTGQTCTVPFLLSASCGNCLPGKDNWPPLVPWRCRCQWPPGLPKPRACGPAAGASGGAVVSACGRLAGLVTSNSRHAASGAPLPRLNYSIAAAALRPLWETLAAARYAGVAGALAFEAGPGAHPASPAPALHHDSGLAQCEGTLGDWQLGSAHAALAELQEQLRALDVSHPDLASLWALASPPDGPRPGPGEPQGEAGPPRSTDSTGAARLARLLDEKGLRQQLWLGEGRPSRSRL